MGVPKFFRWISERYPCLSNLVRLNDIPEFDNLYLDMNGIIHVCSHPEDDNVNFRIDELAIFQNIVHYIEFLFQMIRPQKVFFLAVDGVAPRAKMNQQRSRRFRSAKVMEEQEKQAIEKGIVLPDSQRFDSNCITPGTEFMVRLHEYLQYFIVRKISEDPTWIKVKVIYSGHQTPGEGEHKILDFIRYQRTMKDYDPNTRHCLYGLDADLIMLGLSCHEPYCTLLREEVLFGKKGKSPKRAFVPEEASFYLLHLSLLREYIDLEFRSLKEPGVLPFPYDLERIIDDWVLLAFLVGNDFVPHLPNLHIHADALPMLWRCYKEVLGTLKGYLHDFGDLNITRFLKFLERVAQHDRAQFDKSVESDLWMMGENGRELGDELDILGMPNTPKADKGDRPMNDLMAFYEANDEPAGSSDFGGCLESNPVESTANSSKSQGIDSACLEDEYMQHRRYYYTSKLGISMTPEAMEHQAKGYLYAMQWILFYYYRGTPSWKWFYPQHYAPFVTDVVALRKWAAAASSAESTTSSASEDVDDSEDDGRHFLQADWLEHVRQGHGSLWQCGCSHPFLPFQQLMAVLPAASSQLLPQSYRNLMINSELKDMYPDHFKTDLNGKKQDWEAVVLIPFIEEERLLKALEPLHASLSEAEKQRNSHGPHLVFQYTNRIQSPFHCPGYRVGMSEDLEVKGNHAQCIQMPMDAFWLRSDEIRTSVLPGCHYQSVVHLGFAVLFGRVLKQTELKGVGVKVFEQFSRKESIVLELQPYALDSYTPTVLQSLALRLLNKVVYVEWPHLREALVERIVSLTCEYSLLSEHSVGCRTLDPSESGQIEREYAEACKALLQRRAIRFGTSADQTGEQQPPVKESDRKSDKNSVAPPSPTTWLFVYARMSLGSRYRMRHEKGNSEPVLCLEREWSPESERFLWPQCLALNLQQQGEVETQVNKKVIACRQPSRKKVSEYLIPGSPITCIASANDLSGFGCTGTVINVCDRSREFKIRVTLTDYSNRVDLGTLVDPYYAEEAAYVNATQLLQQLQVALRKDNHPAVSWSLTPPLLARLTGNLFVRVNGDQRSNIGLNLKFNRTNECVLGFTRGVRSTRPNNTSQQGQGRGEGGSTMIAWSYNHVRVVPLLMQYLDACPQLVQMLLDNSSAESFDLRDLFPEEQTRGAQFDALKEFLANLPSSKAPRVGIDDTILPKDILTSLVSIVDSSMERMRFVSCEKSLYFNDIFKYEPLFAGVNPNSLGREVTVLLDRVVNIRSGSQVPFGLRGTVVGVVAGSAPTKAREYVYEILFDLPFPGGIDIRNIKGRGYRLPETTFVNITAKERELGTRFLPLKGPVIDCPFVDTWGASLLPLAATTSTKAAPSGPSQLQTSTKKEERVKDVAPASTNNNAPQILPSGNAPTESAEDAALAMLQQINIQSLLQPAPVTSSSAPPQQKVTFPMPPQQGVAFPKPPQQEVAFPMPPPLEETQAVDPDAAAAAAAFTADLIQNFLHLCQFFGLTAPPRVEEVQLPQADGKVYIECRIHLPHNNVSRRPVTISGLAKLTSEEALFSALNQARDLFQCPPVPHPGPVPKVPPPPAQNFPMFPQPNWMPPPQQLPMEYQHENRGGHRGGYQFSYIPPNIRDDPFRDTFYDPNRERMFQTRERYVCDPSARQMHSDHYRAPPAVGVVPQMPSKPSTMFVPSQVMTSRGTGASPQNTNSRAVQRPSQTAVQSKPAAQTAQFTKTSAQPQVNTPKSGDHQAGKKKANRRVAADFSSPTK